MSMRMFGHQFYLYAIPFAYITAYAPIIVGNYLTYRLSGGAYNNLQPRTQIAELEADGKISYKNARLLERLRAAHQNGLEVVPMFSLALLFAMFRGLSTSSMNISAIILLVSRVAYNICYGLGTSTLVGFLRSLMWGVGFGVSFYLFFGSL